MYQLLLLLYLKFYRSYQTKVEYYFLGEVTGDKQEYADSERRSFQPEVKDDQLLVQLELNF